VLVRFHSEAGSVLMFGEVATAVLKMMGQSGVVPGALQAADVPAALERLKRAAAAAPRDQAGQEAQPEENAQPGVSLRQRAYPLIELLARTAAKEVAVVWEQE